MDRFTRIVCPTDFSKTSDRAAEYAAMLAATFGSELLLLHVIPEIDYPMHSFGISESLAHIQTELDEKAKESLAKVADVAKQAHPDLAVQCILRDGAVHEEILACVSEQNADVVVVGAQGQGMLSDALLGSIAERVIRTATCPVLAVPSPR